MKHICTVFTIIVLFIFNAGCMNYSNTKNSAPDHINESQIEASSEKQNLTFLRRAKKDPSLK